jgi:hypothetical protein
MKRLSVTLAAMVGMAAMLSGCAVTAPAPTPDSTAVDNASPTSEAYDPALCDPAGDSYGDVVPVGFVTDEYGTYCHVGINPELPALTSDAKLTRDLLNQFGISREQALSMQKKALEFTASEFVDSNILDRNTNGVEGNDKNGVEWLEQHKDYFEPGTLPDYQVPGEIFKSGVVVNGYHPVLIRDGKPRIADSSIKVLETYAKESLADGEPASVVVLLEVKVSYRASDAEIVAWKRLNEPEVTEEAIRETSPELFDNTGENNMLLMGKTAYSYNPTTEKFLGNSHELQLDYSAKPGLNP